MEAGITMPEEVGQPASVGIGHAVVGAKRMWAAVAAVFAKRIPIRSKCPERGVRHEI